MKHLNQLYINLLESLHLSGQMATILGITLSIISIIIIAVCAQLITRLIITRIVHHFVKKTKTEWDDYLLKRKVFSALAHIPSALIIYSVSSFSDLDTITLLLKGFAQIYFVVIFSLIFIRFANSVNDIYQTTSYASTRPIKGYVQLLQILIICISLIYVIAILIGKSPMTLFAGLSAMAAVLILVFKDTILGFVASIQLSANKMLKPGDWIEMPSHNADGTVIDITLNTVKVQNWDKTITTIPTYALVSESFNNWAGMEESGGRRIKRSINIDMRSIRFCDDELMERLSHFYLLKDYLRDKQEEIDTHNKKLKLEDKDVFNGRKQTNLGIFRQYLKAYLQQNPNIHQNMTFLVRHLQPTEKGLPIEIYVFSKDQRWAYYESIQADIFDHIIAMLPQFDLKVFQSPSGYDLTEFISNNIKS